MTSDLGTGTDITQKVGDLYGLHPYYGLLDLFSKPILAPLFSYRFEAVAARREEASRGPSEEA